MPDLAISRDTLNEVVDRLQANLNQCIATAAIELGKKIALLDGATITIQLGGPESAATHERIVELEATIRTLQSEKQ